MPINIANLEKMKKQRGYWAGRITSQLEYACKLSKVNGGKFDDLIAETVGYLYESFKRDGCITTDSAKNAENMIGGLSEAAKSFRMICAAHAHIDMNWMWGFAETVAVTLDTFRTMLDLMKEYPDYRFSQSQASVYRIVEEYDPALLEEIRERVREGRWEVTASTWVETDKNMPNGESLSRHILYTKDYLSKLLDISPDSLEIDFEPDTFGHNGNVPEILARGGVKYYYHCRGYDGHCMYIWKSPSGSAVLVYREPLWYNSDIDPATAMHVPEFCTKHGIDTMLKVYGVGDHGGGPTRRDIEKIIDMSTWPVFPAIRFGTFTEYFKLLEKNRDSLPVVEGELNFVFSGCYTTQTRIKMANRIIEARLNEAEAFSTLSSLYAGGTYHAECLGEAWKKALFNHFHDILPGSGVIETREYALGEFQKALAAANTEASLALRNFAAKIDTSKLTAVEGDIRKTRSEGAGVGYAIRDYLLPQTERGRGKTRIFHFFNPSAHERCDAAEITVWDWEGAKDRITVSDSDGIAVRHQMLESDKRQIWNSAYWGHISMKLLVDVKVPACGYSTYILSEKEPEELPVALNTDPRVEKPDSYTLENDLVKVIFDTGNAAIVSMTDKQSGMEMVGAGRPAGIFRLVEEDDAKGMTAWVVGRYMNVLSLNEDVRITSSYSDKNALRQWIRYKIGFRNSSIDVTVSLEYNSAVLNYNVECDWQETGKAGKCVPQLNFYMPLGYKCSSYKYDIPFSTITRAGVDMDVPANSWAAGMPEGSRARGVMLVSNTKYGFRCVDDSISLTLIRSSFDPDPYPDNCIHNFRFAVGAADCLKDTALIDLAYDYNHLLSFVSNTAHTGTLPYAQSFLSLESGSVAISAIKMPEAESGGRKLIIRLYETEGRNSEAVLKVKGKVQKAYYVDINENRLPEPAGKIAADGDKVSFQIGKYSLASICIEI